MPTESVLQILCNCADTDTCAHTGTVLKAKERSFNHNYTNNSN